MINDTEYYVYALEFPDGKKYIGATRNVPSYRWRSGCGYRNQKRLFSAITEVGWENVKPTVLLEKVPKEIAMECEKYLIAKYKTQNPQYGYNTKNGGQSFGEHSPEFIEQVRERMIGNKYCVGRKLRPAHIKALKDSHPVRKPRISHKPHDMETKQYLSELMKKRWQDPVQRERMIRNHADFSGERNPRYGVHLSDETKRKISEANKGRHLTEEHKEKLRGRNVKPVRCLDINGNFICKYESISEAAEAVGAHQVNIGFCCRNPGRTIKGYRWEYDDNAN